MIGSGETVSWKLNLRGKLAPGVYLLYFRTVDGEGNRGAGPRGRRPVRLVVRKSERRSSRHRHHHRANT